MLQDPSSELRLPYDLSQIRWHRAAAVMLLCHAIPCRTLRAAITSTTAPVRCGSRSRSSSGRSRRPPPGQRGPGPGTAGAKTPLTSAQIPLRCTVQLQLHSEAASPNKAALSRQCITLPARCARGSTVLEAGADNANQTTMLTRGAGPRTTLPCELYCEPWHGHMNLFSACKPRRAGMSVTAVCVAQSLYYASQTCYNHVCEHY